MISVDEFRKVFHQRFGIEPEVIARAPGRVNLIGEHTDYNEGYVLPAAIDREIRVGVARREDRRLNAFSIEHGGYESVRLDALQRGEKRSWIDYPAGVAQQMLEGKLPLGGTDLLIAGDVPIGAGLSSSAALLVACATAWKTLYGWEIPEIETIQLCRRAENDYVGVACGIMDQYVSCAGKAGHALFIDCRDLSTQTVALPRNLSILVCDTGVRRDLANTAYNCRRAECEEGASRLRQFLGEIRSLRDVTAEQLRDHSDRLPPVIAKRCRHVVAENERALEAMDALVQGDRERFGRLMNESHESLKNDYEVSCPELDMMVALARGQEGVLGARMTGAGFGGCTVNLVKSERVNEVARAVRKEYAGIFRHPAQTYVCKTADGASILSDE